MSGVGLTFPLCCFHPAVAANNTPLIVNQHRRLLPALVPKQLPDRSVDLSLE
jgi:hypothetical protein